MSTMETNTVSPLTPAEVDQLAKDEAIVAEGLAGFMKVGMALARIRDKRLYRATHSTFEAYLDDRWHLKRTRAYELISAGTIATAVSEISDIPLNEAQAKALGPVVRESGAEAAAAVLADIAETNAGKVTAKAISTVVKPKTTVVGRESATFTIPTLAELEAYTRWSRTPEGQQAHAQLAWESTTHWDDYLDDALARLGIVAVTPVLQYLPSPGMPLDMWLSFVADVSQNGVRSPVLVDSQTGELIDGRTRIVAAYLAGVPCPVRQIDTQGDAGGTALSVNVIRQHTTADQAAMILTQLRGGDDV